MARPKQEFDWKLLEKIAQFPMKQEDIAFIMGCSVDMMQDRIKERDGIGLAEFLDKRKAGMRRMIHEKQFQVAKQGNVAMLIWLGKQLLDQRDKHSNELSGPDGKPIALARADMPDEQIESRIQALLDKRGAK